MMALSDDDLRAQLTACGCEPGPILPSTRLVYQRKLDRLLKDKSNTNSIYRSNKEKPPEAIKTEEPTSRPSSSNPALYSNVPRKNVTAASSPVDYRPHLSDTSFCDPFLDLSNSTCFIAGHAANAGSRSSIGLPSTGGFYNSPDLINNNIRMRPVHSGSQRSESRYCNEQEAGMTYRDGPCTSGASISASQRRSWSFSIPRMPNLSSSLMSDESLQDADKVAHRTHADKIIRHQQLLGESNDRSFYARILGYSFGNHVPNLILFCGITLLLVTTSCYLLLKDKHCSVSRIADLQRVVCPLEESVESKASSTELLSSCVRSRDLPTVLKIIHLLFEILSRFSGEHLCGESVESSRMEVETAKLLVKDQLTSYAIALSSANQADTLWRGVLILINEVGQKHLEIAAYDTDGQQALTWRDVQELESLRPYIPGSCRLRLLVYSILRFLNKLFWLLCVLVAVSGFCYIAYHIRQLQRNRTEKRAVRVREIVHEVSSILQQQLQLRQSNPKEPPYVPVSIIKKRLSRTNPSLADFWPEVEHYVHLVEGSILVQEWRGIGETWQWQVGSGWQGSALVDKSQRLPFTTPPTECLKIRNMFTVDSMGISAKQRLKRELLNRTAECGSILHIGLDHQNNQGLVYIKCASPAVAGKVFEAIHAHYFDSHLLTVKFLRASKYNLRFPDAHDAVTPLRAVDFE